MPKENPPQRIKVKCPQCQKSIRAPARMAGKSGKCPGCGAKVSIPELASSSLNEGPKPPVAEVKQLGALAASTPTPAFVPRLTGSNTETTVAKPDSTQPEKSTGGKFRFNLIGQVICWAFFCIALLSFGMLRESASTTIVRSKSTGEMNMTLLLYASVGVCYGMIAWASCWFVLLNASLWKRVVGLSIVMANFIAALLAGVMIAGGAGPISIDEALAGWPVIPVLFLVFQLPLWGLAFFNQGLHWRCHVVQTLDNRQANENQITNILTGLGLVVVVSFCGFIARFPGVNSVVAWSQFVASFVVAGLITALPAVMVAWKINNNWLSWALAVVHAFGMVVILYLTFSLQFVPMRPQAVEWCISLGTFMVALYVPLMMARLGGLRLTNLKTAVGAKSTLRTTKFDKSAVAVVAILPLVIFLSTLAGTVRFSSKPQTPAPPAAIVPVVRAQDSGVMISLGIVLAKDGGKAYIFAQPWPEPSIQRIPGEGEREDEGLPKMSLETAFQMDKLNKAKDTRETAVLDPADYSVVIEGTNVPVELVVSKLKYRIGGPGWSSSGGFKGAIFSVDASKVPDPAIFGVALDCNEQDILGAVGVAKEKPESGSDFFIYQDDLLITTIIRDSSRVKRMSAKRLTKSSQRPGIAYNQSGELIGLVEPVYNSKKALNVVNIRYLKMLASACADHVPRFYDELAEKGK